MVDLRGQFSGISSEVHQAISEVLESSAFIQGPQVKTLEARLATYHQVSHCISCANGTDALQIAMMALDLKPGDEVIVPAFTYVATVEAAALLGIKPVLAEVDAATFNILPSSIRKAISNRTRAIIPVHLYGQCAAMEEILEIAKQHQLFIIEDAAQSIGAKYHFKDGHSGFAGTLGTIGTTSFFPSKNLGCYGDGGALFTNEESLAAKVRMIANHGQGKKYHHERVGINSRLDTLQAAILQVKLKYLDQYTSARQKAAHHYDNSFGSHPCLDIPARDQASTHVFHQYTLKVKEGQRDELKKFLESKGIPSMIYYPVPVHFQSAYQFLGYQRGAFPVSEQLSQQVISLPMHTELTEDQLSYITDSVLSFFK